MHTARPEGPVANDKKQDSCPAQQGKQLLQRLRDCPVI